MAGWRYFAERLHGDGTSTLIHPNLPLSDVSITQTLSGPGGLSARITPEVMALTGEDGLPIFQRWSTAIWAENGGSVHGGGILAHTSVEDYQLNLECVGFSGYLNDLPYTAENFFVEADPMDIARHIWQHVQAQPGGNLGVTLDATKSPKKIGTVLQQVEFDTQAGPVSFEAGPYKLAWWQTHNLQSNFDGLAEETPFSYQERMSLRDDGSVAMHLQMGYPTLGRRQSDLRFHIGENVNTIPSIEYAGDQFANEVILLGAGEGRTMIRGEKRRQDGLLRRVAIVQDKQVRSKSSAVAQADRELALRRGEYDITDLQVLDHSHAPLGSWGVGDEIQLQGDLGWVDNEAGVWVRVVSLTITPDSPEVVGASVIRTDKVAA